MTTKRKRETGSDSLERLVRAEAAIGESLAIYESLRLANGGTDDITIAVVRPLQYHRQIFCPND